jgi:hypothetical protein
MPLLDNSQIDELVALAHLHGYCGECGHHTAQDYCRTCDEFYWIHAPGCLLFTSQHYGHRLQLVPFVEDWHAHV